MEIRNTIRVEKRRNPLWYNCLVGLEGIVYDIDNSVYTDWEKRNGAEKKLKVKAINYGKPMLEDFNGKKRVVFQWKPGNICTFYEEELTQIEDREVEEEPVTDSLFGL